MTRNDLEPKCSMRRSRAASSQNSGSDRNLLGMKVLCVVATCFMTISTAALLPPGEGPHDEIAPQQQSPGSSAASPELVSFPTADGGVVHAHLYGEGERGVVLAHGGRFTKESWEEQAPRLVEAGFRVLAIDFRGRGQSRGPNGEDDEGAYFDVLAAIRFLRANGTDSVSVIGASFGGGAAAEASTLTEPGELDRLILLAHSPILEPEQMKGRKLFVMARDDASGAARAPRLPAIREQYEKAPGPKEFVLLEGSAHAQFLFTTDQAKRLMDEILRFLLEP